MLTNTNAYNKVAAITALLLIAGVCLAEYDLYCIGSSYIIDHEYIKSMADSAGIGLKAGRSEIFGNMRSIQERCQAIIHRVVYDTVRNTPYSGWYKDEPDSLDAYMIHLQKGLKNWESFDKMYPASGTGAFTGDNGIQWNYTNLSSGKDGETLTDAFIIMHRGSSLSATIPGGIRDLHFAMYQNAEIEVKVDDKSMGTFKPVREGGWNNHYFKIKDMNKTGDATVEFTCRSHEAIMDNISWTAPK